LGSTTLTDGKGNAREEQMTSDHDNGATRRQMLASAGSFAAAGAMAATFTNFATAAAAEATKAAGGSSVQVGPTILEYLGDLERAVGELANTWRPNDPEYRADVYRQIMMHMSYGYFVAFHADPEHPDWAPLWNPVFTCQPNPDDIYLYAPVRGDLSYRISGNRGTTRLLIISTSHGVPGIMKTDTDTGGYNEIDSESIKTDANGDFEVIISPKKPAGYEGNWMPIAPNADFLMTRYRMFDWTKERDPQMSIECLDNVPLKPRLTPQQILDRIKIMAQVPVNMTHVFFKLQNDIKKQAGVNKFMPQNIQLVKQLYWPAVFEFEDGEALIIETEMPKKWLYWNIQLNDPYFNAVEYVYRLSSINGSTAKISSDGKLRAVISLTDPGVPNWLDPAGYKQGTIYGRWYEADSHPLPTLTRVSLKDLHKHLPKDTPKVTPEQRKQELRTRVLAAQKRRRW
jgi:hypothetical protein